jgi:putative transposase
MNTRKIAEEYRLSHWAGIMQERIDSGLSVKDFCKSAGFHENVYYYWQRKLRESACQKLLPAAQNGQPESIVPSGWAACEAEHDVRIDNAVSIEIGKCRVTANGSTDPEVLAKICKILLSLC